MSKMPALADLRNLLATVEVRDDYWAHRVCNVSRRVHIRVWSERPDLRFVKREVVPLLTKAHREVEKIARGGTGLGHVFAKNMLMRLESIANYLSDESPIFSPLADLAGTEEDLLADLLREIERLKAQGEGPARFLQGLADLPEAKDMPAELGVKPAKHPVIVRVKGVTQELLCMLKRDPSSLATLSPEQFENLVADRLEHMGYRVNLTGALNSRDGGVDLVATPKVQTTVPFVIAGQVKHHRHGKRTGVEAVARFLAWKGTVFKAGLLVTNTDFTSDALWLAAQENNRYWLQLRNIEALKRWIQDNFFCEQDWRSCEMPEQIELAPEVTVKIPGVEHSRTRKFHKK